MIDTYEQPELELIYLSTPEMTTEVVEPTSCVPEQVQFDDIFGELATEPNVPPPITYRTDTASLLGLLGVYDCLHPLVGERVAVIAPRVVYEETGEVLPANQAVSKALDITKRTNG